MNQAAWIPVAVGVTATLVLAGPDIALCEISEVTGRGTLEGTMAYSIGTNAVNIGSDNLDVIRASHRHPVLGHNMYRLKDGRFEQIGQAWVRHGFHSLQMASPCVSGCPGSPCCLQVLLPAFQDTHTSSRNGSHTLLGPKHLVNAHTGEFTFPFADGDQGPGGVNYDGTDWSVMVGGGAVTWSVNTGDEDGLADALRWGTLYNFRVDADSPPASVTATCPWDCEANPDGAVGITDFLTLVANWGPCR